MGIHSERLLKDIVLKGTDSIEKIPSWFFANLL